MQSRSICASFTAFGSTEDADGGRYEGEFKRGKPDGQGVFTAPSGMRYKGDFKKGTFHGHGVAYRADGSVYYDGGYKNGKWHGHGVNMSADGAVRFEGGFNKGLRHGHGVLSELDFYRCERDYKRGDSIEPSQLLSKLKKICKRAWVWVRG